jgi:hypothetical protein
VNVWLILHHWFHYKSRSEGTQIEKSPFRGRNFSLACTKSKVRHHASTIKESYRLAILLPFPVALVVVIFANCVLEDASSRRPRRC